LERLYKPENVSDGFSEDDDEMATVARFGREVQRANMKTDKGLAAFTITNGVGDEYTEFFGPSGSELMVGRTGKGIFVAGHNGQATVPADVPDEQVYYLIHRVMGYKAPEELRAKYGKKKAIKESKDATGHEHAPPTHPVTDAYISGVDTLQETAERAVRRLLKRGRSATMGTAGLFTGEELEEIAVAIGRGQDVAAAVGREVGRRDTEAKIVANELKELS
jgi:hypothetical protein